MSQPIIILLITGVILFFRWMERRASQQVEENQTPPENQTKRAPAPPPAASDAERVRRFLEALGAPPGSNPPLPVRPRSTLPRRVITPQTPAQPRAKVRRSWAQPLPPLTTTPPDLPAKVEVIVPPPRPAAVTPPQVAATRTAAPWPRAVAVASEAPRSSLGAILRNRESTRRAIMLREILGPPRGLQAFAEIGGF